MSTFNQLHRLLFPVCAALFAIHTANAMTAVDLNGKWYIEFNFDESGIPRTIMQFDVDSDAMTFEAHSRSDAARNFLGEAQAKLAEQFTKNFTNGALVHLQEGKIELQGDQLLLTATFVSAIGTLEYSGTVTGSVMSGTFLREGQLRGSLRGTKDNASLPLSDYPALIEKALALTESHLYNHTLLEKDEWVTFSEKLRQMAQGAQDDLDVLFAFFQYAKDLPFSHYNFLRPNEALRKLLEGTASEEASAAEHVVFEEKNPGVAYLKISSFAVGTRSIDSLFTIIRDKDYPNLILDLRDNPGGNISAMRVSEHLVDKEYPGGFFVTGKWFAQHSEPPVPGDCADLPTLSESNVNLLYEGIHNEQAVCLSVTPVSRPYSGKVYVLTNKKTASAAEPLVYGLQQNGRAAIVGEKTAGAMLNGEHFEVGDGWKLTIPTADYYASDGFHIDRVGVTPDHKVPSDNALEKTLELIGQ